jgi:hypothetical protein
MLRSARGSSSSRRFALRMGSRSILRHRLVHVAPVRRLQACSQPGCKLALGELAFGKPHHRQIFFFVGGDDICPAEDEKRPVGHVRGALVAIDKRVIACQTECKRCSQIREVGCRVSICSELLRSSQRRFE